VKNLRDIRRSDIFRGYFDKNFKVCPIYAIVSEWEWEYELVRVIGKALNKTLHQELTIFK
jgi:hypothetical protein